MRIYLSRRLLQFVAVLWGAATLNFFIPRLAPGDPVRDKMRSLTLARSRATSSASGAMLAGVGITLLTGTARFKAISLLVSARRSFADDRPFGTKT